MANERSFPAALNEQIANEFGAAMQYIGAAVYYDAETLPRLAAFFYRQAAEERHQLQHRGQAVTPADLDSARIAVGQRGRGRANLTL